MAARRLILVLVLLLVISSVAAQLAQPPETGEETSSDETAPTTSTVGQADGSPGRLLRRRVAAGAAEPTEIRARAGDQLALIVSVGTPGSVRIPELGLTEGAVPEAPARFDLLLRRAGRLEVRGPNGRAAALIIVDAAEPGGTAPR